MITRRHVMRGAAALSALLFAPKLAVSEPLAYVESRLAAYRLVYPDIVFKAWIDDRTSALLVTGTIPASGRSLGFCHTNATLEGQGDLYKRETDAVLPKLIEALLRPDARQLLALSGRRDRPVQESVG